MRCLENFSVTAPLPHGCHGGFIPVETFQRVCGRMTHGCTRWTPGDRRPLECPASHTASGACPHPGFPVGDFFPPDDLFRHVPDLSQRAAHTGSCVTGGEADRGAHGCCYAAVPENKVCGRFRGRDVSPRRPNSAETDADYERNFIYGLQFFCCFLSE